MTESTATATTTLRRVTQGDALVSLNAACCRTTFTARTSLAAERLHVEYHNSQHRRGRRESKISMTTPSFNVVVLHSASALPTLAASMISYAEALELQSALVNLGNAGAADVLAVKIVRVNE